MKEYQAKIDEIDKEIKKIEIRISTYKDLNFKAFGFVAILLFLAVIYDSHDIETMIISIFALLFLWVVVSSLSENILVYFYNKKIKNLEYDKKMLNECK